MTPSPTPSSSSLPTPTADPNTIRLILGNFADFDPACDTVPDHDG
jgi:hypothetical protein